jgi:RimJ/RimL family protein N-acetyltransferase
MKSLETERLALFAEDAALAQATVDGPEAMSDLLNASVPPEWPPELFADVVGYWIPRLTADPANEGWCVWHIVRKSDRVVIGLTGFKGQPVDGRVDVGYAILDAFQRRGYATEAVTAVMEWAFADARVDYIVGETLPHLTPSIGVMEKLGFAFVTGDTIGHEGEAGVVQYRITRAAFEGRGRD